jgi:dTDP-4-dehydrorhamnose 3,5-epimerase
MKAIETALAGVMLFEPELHGDARGGLMESYQRARYRAAGIATEFVQDNLAFSRAGVLRGLHLQHPKGQDKLVQAVAGEVFDVAVDVRVGSPRFGRWVGERLSAANRRQMFIPRGFAHGYCVLSETATVLYKCGEAYAPECELTLLWNDPAVGIAWPIADPELSDKDRGGLALAALAPRLPPFEPAP